ncbi:MAG: MerC family mercury resistance protein, partial [Pseudomonadota bacterium]|nr:MerC family mercury resistance protein [Pseudomonadota bacterium]
HKSRRILICGFAGVFVLVVAAILGGQHLGEIGETVLTVLGASVVALAHWFNFRACRACDCEHH